MNVHTFDRNLNYWIIVVNEQLKMKQSYKWSNRKMLFSIFIICYCLVSSAGGQYTTSTTTMPAIWNYYLTTQPPLCPTGKPCQYDGPCVYYNGGYTCLCITGYTPSCQGATPTSTVYLYDDTTPQTKLQYIGICDMGNLCWNRGTCNDYSGGYTCICEVGYKPRCEDVDECNNTNYFCGGNCKNTVGSWDCECLPGYMKTTANNSRTIYCTDIDECSKDNPCREFGACYNSPGSFRCQCNDGYRRFNDVTCLDIDECTEAKPCEDFGVCQNNPGGYTCQCNKGYKRLNNSLCEDINECSIGNPCMEYGVCQNNRGGYTCLCQNGYKRYNDTTCEDINECGDAKPCMEFGVCQNYHGGYTCQCNKGYRRFNTTSCTDIDECSEGKPCMDFGVCLNRPGGYTCQCYQGYKRYNDITCEDINECTEGRPCMEFGICENHPGYYTCLCNKGYARYNATTCVDIDECHTEHYLCEGFCTNNAGSWNCDCRAGYNKIMTSDNRVIYCTDIDECSADNPHVCIGGTCKNILGSWECVCVDGETHQVINDTIKACTGIYQYVVSLRFSAAGTTELIEQNEQQLKDYIREQMTSAYRYPFFSRDFYVDVLAIKRDIRNRRAVRDVSISLWKVSIVMKSAMHVRQDDLAPVWSQYISNYCQERKCGNPPLPLILLEIETAEDPALILCNSQKYNYCDEKTTDCVYTNNKLMCPCKSGYEPKQNTDLKCIDIDECHNKRFYCGGSCRNTDGSWYCDCRSGYSKTTSTDSRSVYCTDIDECNDNYHFCAGNCKNTDGSWNCECAPGYTETTTNDYRTIHCTVDPDVCKKNTVCKNSAFCKYNYLESFECVCGEGWSGRYCEIPKELISDTHSDIHKDTQGGLDKSEVIAVAVGGCLIGIVIILLISGCWGSKRRAARKAAKEKTTRKKKMRNNSFQPNDSPSVAFDRKNGDSMNIQEQTGKTMRKGHTVSDADLSPTPPTPHRLQKEPIHCSVIDLTNSRADYNPDEHQHSPKRQRRRHHHVTKTGFSYTANNERSVPLDDENLRRYPKPDYDNYYRRPPSPQPDYRRNERPSTSRDGGMVLNFYNCEIKFTGAGHSSNGRLSLDYMPSRLREITYEIPKGETRF